MDIENSLVKNRGYAADEKGTAALEFALLSPLFLLMLFGMVAYGIYFGASHSLQQIAADAARTAVAGVDQKERQSLVDAFLSRNVASYTFIDPRKLKVVANDNPADNSQFVVTLTYDAGDLPVWNLMTGLPLPRMTIAKRTTIRIGGI